MMIKLLKSTSDIAKARKKLERAEKNAETDEWRSVALVAWIKKL